MKAMCGVQIRQIKIYGFNAHIGFEGNHRSDGYGKQCSLVCSCVEDVLRRALDFD